MTITYFKRLFGTSDPYYCDPLQVLKRIKDGNSKDLIGKIRSETNKERRDDLKKELNCILFSGKFSQRSKDHLLEYSGLIVLDIDDIDIKDLNKVRKIIEDDSYTYTCFLSPSGNGLKIVYKISDDEENHLPHFLSIEKYLNEKLSKFTSTKKNEKTLKGKSFKIDEAQGDFLKVHIDKSGKDTARVCFESYDPNLYWNELSDIYDGLIEVKSVVVQRPQTDETRILSLLAKWAEEKHGYYEGNRNKFLMILSSSACRFGINEVSVMSFVANNYPDYPTKDFEKEIKSHYRANAASFGTEEFVEKVYESKQERKKISFNNKVTAFWYISDKGKVTIDSKLLLAFIEAQGFAQVRFKVDDIQFVRVNNMIVDIVDKVHIKHIVLEYVSEKAPEPVFNELATSSFFQSSFLNALLVIDVDQVRDKIDESYVFFEGFYYRITKDVIERRNYIQLNGVHIWKSQVCKQNITDFVDYRNHDYYKFICNTICGGEYNEQKMDRLMTGIGYLAHTYKKQSRAHLLYFCEDSMDEIEGHASGGTGKGLVYKAIEQIRSVITIDGKVYNKGNSFAFSGIGPDTQVVVLEDYEGDFGELFNKVTGSFETTKKGKDTVSIPFSQSAKVGVSSNNSPLKNSWSYERRLHLVEFSDFYGKHNPVDFPVDFFSEDWGEHDWNCVFSFLFDCIKKYLATGLVKYNSANAKDKKIIRATNIEFFEYWTVANGHVDLFSLDYKQNVVEHLTKFKTLYPKHRYVESTDFIKLLKEYALALNVKYCDSSNGVNRKFWFKSR